MRTLLMVAAAAAVACNVDLGVPSSVEIACDSAGDCPSGFRCSERLGRCVPEDAGPAPGLVEGRVTLTPTYAAAGATLAAGFTVDEPLALWPEVTLRSSPALVLTLDEDDFPSYAFSGQVTGAEAEGSCPVEVWLIDLSGNEATIPIGEITLDFSVPRVVDSPTLSPTTAGSGQTVTATFAVDEILGEPPQVSFQSVPPIPFTLASDTPTWVFTRTLDGTEPQGELTVEVDLVDRAGNHGAEELGTVTVTP